MRKVALVFCLIIFLISAWNASAKVLELQVSSKNLNVGDVITVYGKANPNEEVKINVLFEKTLSVKNGIFAFSASSIKVPEGECKVNLVIYNSSDVKISARKQIFGFLYTPWIDLKLTPFNGFASISKSISSGVYDFKVEGKSNSNSVKIKIIASGYVKANSEGEFNYSYDTSSIPSGKFIISAGEKAELITLTSKKEKTNDDLLKKIMNSIFKFFGSKALLG